MYPRPFVIVAEVQNLEIWRDGGRISTSAYVVELGTGPYENAAEQVLARRRHKPATRQGAIAQRLVVIHPRDYHVEDVEREGRDYRALGAVAGESGRFGCIARRGCLYNRQGAEGGRTGQICRGSVRGRLS